MDKVARATRRLAGRIVLLDPNDRVLLLQEREGRDEPQTLRWLTPGGGVEAAESPAAAAVRELYEETGIEVELHDGATAWYVDRVVWTIDGSAYDQTNHYFLARLEHVVPVVQPAQLTDYERAVTMDARWWTVQDLRSTSESVYPAALPRLLWRELRR